MKKWIFEICSAFLVLGVIIALSGINPLALVNLNAILGNLGPDNPATTSGAFGLEDGGAIPAATGLIIMAFPIAR